MSTTIQDIEILRTYISGVLDRANHHAQNVNEIALAIAGGIVWRTTESIRVMSRDGEMKNVLWLKVDDKTICFVYNHNSGNIDIREGSIQSATIISVNNLTPLSDIKNFFEQL